jgi:5,10-methylenetetrahydrofolate reductase
MLEHMTTWLRSFSSSVTGIQFVRNMGHDLSEHKINTTILPKVEKNTTDIYKMLQKIYEHQTFSRTQPLFRVKYFKVEGVTEVVRKDN